MLATLARNRLLARESDAKFGALGTVCFFLFSSAACASIFMALDRLFALAALFLSSSALSVADMGLWEELSDPTPIDCPFVLLCCMAESTWLLVAAVEGRKVAVLWLTPISAAFSFGSKVHNTNAK